MEEKKLVSTLEVESRLDRNADVTSESSMVSAESDAVERIERKRANPPSIEAEPGRKSFELVSYTIPARSSLEKGNARDVTHTDFEKNISLALGTFIKQMPLGATLVVEYQLVPSGLTGGMSIRCVLHTQQALGVGSSDLSHELAVCLATVSDFFGFRVDSENSNFKTASMGDVVCIRPVSVACGSHAGAIGFTQSRKDPLATIFMPVISSIEATIPSSGLVNTFKAARASCSELRLSIRVTRERLDSACKASLSSLLNHDLQPNGDDDDKPAINSSTLKLAHAWSNVQDVFRVELEASGTNISASLLSILASELFPGRQVEIVPKGKSAQKNAAMDMSNIFPLAFGVPPLLPHPSALESLAFPRHYNNPVVSLPDSGLVLGHTLLGGFEQPVSLTEPDRRRHTYILGTTGSGKSSMLYNMICQDMAAGNGVILIDPHGDLFNQVRNSVPNNRLSDVIIIDPSDANSSFSLNPMDFGGKATPRKVSRVINELLDIFSELYDMRESGGPGFENYFRNCFLLASTAPENSPPDGLPKGPPTFLTAIEILRNKDYRNFLLDGCARSHLGNDFGGEVARFFAAAAATTGDQSFANWVPYVSSKLTRLISNPVMRKVFCTPKRSFDIRRAIDEQRIVLVNLNKGDLGDQDARMLGMLLTKNIFDAALSRSNLPLKSRKPVFCYVDEFTSLVTNRDIPNALAEGRKYGLFWVLAHQTLGQLCEKNSRATLDTILGNVGNKFFFRVGLRDAEQIELELKPHFNASELTMLPDRHVLAKILVNNKPTPAFVFETLPVVIPELESPDAIADGKGNSDAATDTQAALVETGELILDGVLGVKFSAGEAEQAKELRSKINRVLKGWKNMPNPESPIPPEKNCFFLTRNNSLVYVLSIDSDGDAKALVVTGGHGEEGDLRGRKPGVSYMLNRQGRYYTRYPSLSMLGMDLARKTNVRFGIATTFSEQVDSHGQWLLQNNQERSCVPVRPGFFRTFNNSIVFFSKDDAKKSLPNAIVCSGGHGISELPGTQSSEKITLTIDGLWLADFSLAQRVPAQTLALAGGLNLAEFLPLAGDDVPAWLKTNMARQKRQPRIPRQLCSKKKTLPQEKNDAV